MSNKKLVIRKSFHQLDVIKMQKRDVHFQEHKHIWKRNIQTYNNIWNIMFGNMALNLTGDIQCDKF